MFAILRKTVDNRTHDLYFKCWENAKKEMQKEIEARKSHGWKVVRFLDEFNRSKGISIYQCEMITTDNEKAIFALIDGYFMD